MNDHLNVSLAHIDPAIQAVLDDELDRERSYLEMIASENFAPISVLESAGSVLTNKYAEGYPGRRYYAGCGPVDVAEELAIERAKALFGAEYANVQPTRVRPRMPRYCPPSRNPGGTRSSDSGSITADISPTGCH